MKDLLTQCESTVVLFHLNWLDNLTLDLDPKIKKAIEENKTIVSHLLQNIEILRKVNKQQAYYIRALENEWDSRDGRDGSFNYLT
jgi:hypothetical protein